MAEIRKYDPAKGNAIAEALRAAMGDPIRPATPGQPATTSATQPTPPSAPAWISLSLVTTDETEADDQAE
jgi:hypothetical protein